MNRDKPSILIIDDNEELHFALRIYLTPHFGRIDAIRTPNQIPVSLERTSYDVILLDMNFNAGVNTGNEGIYWLRRILEIDPSAAVVMITAFGDIELAVRSIKEGATDFIHKSWDDQKILSTLLAAYRQRCAKLEIRELKEKQKHLTRQINQKYQMVIGKSPAMQRVTDTIRKVAPTEANILITGENGTGKELVAREIHNLSQRSGQLFVNIDMGAITESLFESELFGYRRGAFTDAKEDRIGRIEVTNGGTLFLDEIGNIPLNLQSKLLVVLQNREVVPIGSTVAKAIDIRLITATSHPLKSMVGKGMFREDLLYRINTITIELPPLRERPEDIPELANFFLRKYTDHYGKNGMVIQPSAMGKLMRYAWPGNIRELQHTIERSVILSESDSIDSSLIITDSSQGNEIDEHSRYNLFENEKRLIVRAIEHTEGNIKLAASKLGINRSTLYDKMKRYGI
jgi:DNA-binding NtrC family response regulator